MHDDLGSGLSAIHLLSNYLSDNAEEKYPEFTSEVNKIRKSSEDLNQSIREIIWTVNTKDDTLSSLALFIRRYAHELQENAKIPIHVQMENPMPEIQLNGVQRKHLFLCVKEAINNAIKHGKPEVINVNIQIENENMISIKIQDNGKGFDLGQSNQRNSGNGLKNIKERMGEIGGLAQFESGEKGTTVLLQIKV
ncbi:MAG: ATP-binding protein, partial [Saprospiraceae bacterium]|nr:ATP-binding protein [Saprospiraceae bacterium]